jgi:hypothetical protein
MKKHSEYLNTLYPPHDFVLEGRDSFNGVGMYRCSKCGKTDVQLSSLRWQKEQALKVLENIDGKDRCIE